MDSRRMQTRLLSTGPEKFVGRRGFGGVVVSCVEDDGR